MPTQPSPPWLPPAPPQRIALRRIWALLRPYWFSDDRWPGRGLLALVLGLNLGLVRPDPVAVLPIVVARKGAAGIALRPAHRRKGRRSGSCATA